MKKLQYTFKTDTLFKMLFVKYPELLKELVANLLGISSGSIGQFTIKVKFRACQVVCIWTMLVNT